MRASTPRFTFHSHLLRIGLACALPLLWANVVPAHAQNPGAERDLRTKYSIDSVTLPDAQTGGRLHISGDLSEKGAGTAVQGAGITGHRAAATTFLQQNATLLGVADAGALTETWSNTDRFGRTHFSYTQYVGGLPVDGMEVLVHVDEGGRVYAVNGNTVPMSANAIAAAADTAVTRLTEAEIRAVVLADLAADGYAADTVKRLTLEARAINTRPYVLWRGDAVLYDGAGRWIYTIDGGSGKILEKRANMQHAPAIGTGVGVLGNAQNHIDTFSGTSFTLQDISRQLATNPHGHNGQMGPTDSITTLTSGGVPLADVDNIWNAPTQAAGVDAHVYAGFTYDYWLGQHGLNGIDGLGSSMFSMVGVATGSCSGTDNAFWDGTQVTYCAGATALPLSGALDIVAHEWAHAVTELVPGARRADLVYAWESGALNESFSDCMGTAVEHARGDTDWIVGDGIFAIRSLANPPAFGNPAYVGQPGLWEPVDSCVPTLANDVCWVHHNSGVPNKMFYLLSEGTAGEPGGVFNGVAVTGLGINTAIAIMLDANVNFWIADETFVGARQGMIDAAIPYGAAAVAGVKNAWAAVKVGTPAIPGSHVELSLAGPPVEVCGDGDTRIEPGEHWQYPVTAKNTGSTAAASVQATVAVAGAPATVNLLTPTLSFPDLGAEAAGTAMLDFSLDLAFGPCGQDVVIDQTDITFTGGSMGPMAGALHLPTGGADVRVEMLHEDFESAASFANWTISNGPGAHTGGQWARVPDHHSARPRRSTGFFAMADSDGAGPGSFTSTILTSPSMNMSGVTAGPVLLEVDYLFLDFPGNGANETASVQVYNGSSWVTLVAHTTGAVANAVFDVSAYAVGNVNFRVRFNYQNANWDFWFAVDNVRVTVPQEPVCDNVLNCAAMTPEITWVTPPPATAQGLDPIPLSWQLAGFTGPITLNQAHFGIKSVLGSSPVQPGTNGTHSHTFAAPNVGTFDSPENYAYIIRALDNGTQFLSPVAFTSVSAGATPPTVAWVTPPPASVPSGGQFTASWTLSNYQDPANFNACGCGITTLLLSTPDQPGGNGTYSDTLNIPVISASGTIFCTAYAMNGMEFAFATVVPVLITVP